MIEDERTISETQEMTGKENNKSEIGEWIKSIVIAVILAIIIKMALFDFVIVKGSSMHPTLETGDRLVLNKIEYTIGSPDYGEIVVLDAGQNEDFIKRVIAKGGDTIEIRNQKVYLNGEEKDEPYISPEYYPDFGPVTVPEGKYFVMGDNRANSMDSRYQRPGFVAEDDMIGHAIFRFWPFSKFGKVN